VVVIAQIYYLCKLLKFEDNL